LNYTNEDCHHDSEIKLIFPLFWEKQDEFLPKLDI